VTVLPPELASLSLPQAIELAKRQHLGVWTERVRGFDCAPFQWEWCELAMTQQRLTVVAPRDHSKALALDTLVLRPDGTHTPIGQLAVGDEVVDRSGAPTRVTALSPVFTDHDCYRLVLDDGQTFVADAGHRWITHYAWRGERTVTTEEIAADTELAARRGQRHVIPEGRRSKATGRSVRSCDRTLTVPVRCITTEAGTFQIGEGVVTHNSETFSVDSCAWRICYRPGIQCVIFTSDVEVAKELKERVDTAVRQHDESLIDGATVRNVKRTDFANGASIRVRTTGQKVRGLHPDHIVGDDVLSDENTITHYQRKKVERWWFATVEGMAHPGTWRVVGRHKVWMPPTTIHLVGTPFHQSDLLMSMRSNPVYRYRRYAAEYAPSDLVPGTCAVEAA